MNPLRSLGAILAALALAGCQALHFPRETVTGTGDPGKDVAAVQAAADRGGVVALKGTFNFGEREQVILRKDVEFVGVDGAKITGGKWAFMSPVPKEVPAAPGPKIAIRDLHFDGALYGPINIGHASGLAVTGNRITGVRPHPLPLPNMPDAQGVNGIFWGPAWALPPGEKRAYRPGVFTGKVLIENNIIDVTVPAPDKTLGYGIFGQWTTGVDAIIRGNTVTNASRLGIENIDHIRGPDGTGRVRILANKVTTPDQGIPFPGRQAPNGILLGYFADRSAAGDPARAIAFEVADNVVDARGSMSMGIAVLAGNAQVSGNTIKASGTTSMPLLVSGSDVNVRQNTISGSGQSAFTVPSGQRNVFKGNDVRAFVPHKSHVMFGKDAADNVCEGQQFIVKVTDEGLRNRCP